MRNEFTAIIFQDGDGYVGYCAEMPEANGQGGSLEDCRRSLANTIRELLNARRQDGLRGVPPEAVRETLVVE